MPDLENPQEVEDESNPSCVNSTIINIAVLEMDFHLLKTNWRTEPALGLHMVKVFSRKQFYLPNVSFAKTSAASPPFCGLYYCNIFFFLLIHVVTFSQT